MFGSDGSPLNRHQKHHYIDHYNWTDDASILSRPKSDGSELNISWISAGANKLSFFFMLPDFVGRPRGLLLSSEDNGNQMGDEGKMLLFDPTID